MVDGSSVFEVPRLCLRRTAADATSVQWAPAGGSVTAAGYIAFPEGG